jgi:alginate O-acetyltransferase complex protein AlgI
MVFSSLIFLFVFLPIVLGGFYIVRKEYRNTFLFLSSIIFFAWGGVTYTGLLLFSILFNFIIGLRIGKAEQKRIKQKRILGLGIIINLLFLGVFKYANFFVANLNELLTWIDIPQVEQTSIILPIGISFYTFQAISYLIDIYRKEVETQKSFVNLGLYISLFPQLIAGPIVRYHDIAQQLSHRIFSYEKFSSGVVRFSLGLAKKVLIANNMAIVADYNFNMDPSGLSSGYAWLGIIAYTLQIYYDFSGYSDMAIGLGRMFGFEILENFNVPYIARSIKDFWRRWHISLSSWFRDYLYISLGGNRKGNYRTYFNLFIVFFVTGFWHGASWNFIVWGLLHGFFLILERFGFEKILKKLPAVLSISYTLFVAIMAWVLFRANDFSHAWVYYKAMFGGSSVISDPFVILQYLNYEVFFFFIIGALGAFNFFPFIYKKIKTLFGDYLQSSVFVNIVIPTVKSVFVGIVFLLVTTYLLSSTYNPFIYYRF